MEYVEQAGGGQLLPCDFFIKEVNSPVQVLRDLSGVVCWTLTVSLGKGTHRFLGPGSQVFRLGSLFHGSFWLVHSSGSQSVVPGLRWQCDLGMVRNANSWAQPRPAESELLGWAVICGVTRRTGASDACPS